jgi:hypothetical protein
LTLPHSHWNSSSDLSLLYFKFCIIKILRISRKTSNLVGNKDLDYIRPFIVWTACPYDILWKHNQLYPRYSHRSLLQEWQIAQVISG